MDLNNSLNQKLSTEDITMQQTSSGSKIEQGNAIIPQKRVIKQIVSIDSKKCKELGIESNILSAMSKLNGKNICSILINFQCKLHI